MPKRVIVEHVQVGRDGSLCIRALKQVTLDSEIHSSQPHLHRVEPGDSLDESLEALGAHLALNGWPTLSEDDFAFVRAQHAAAT